MRKSTHGKPLLTKWGCGYKEVGMGSRGSGYKRNGSVRQGKPTDSELKLMKRTSFDGQIAYVNPETERLIAVVPRYGEMQVNNQELEKFRKTHDMKTGRVKKEHIRELAKQYQDIQKSGKSGEELEDQKYSALLELTQIAKKINPDIGDAVEWRNGVGTVINSPILREVEKTLGVKIM